MRTVLTTLTLALLAASAGASPIAVARHPRARTNAATPPDVTLDGAAACAQRVAASDNPVDGAAIEALNDAILQLDSGLDAPSHMEVDLSLSTALVREPAPAQPHAHGVDISGLIRAEEERARHDVAAAWRTTTTTATYTGAGDAEAEDAAREASEDVSASTSQSESESESESQSESAFVYAAKGVLGTLGEWL